MLIVAVLIPVLLGSNVISNVVEFPAETNPDGLAVTVKSPAFAPEIVIEPTVKTLVPVFSIVNVFALVAPATDNEPKSVSSAVLGVVSHQRHRPPPTNPPLKRRTIQGENVSYPDPILVTWILVIANPPPEIKHSRLYSYQILELR